MHLWVEAARKRCTFIDACVLVSPHAEPLTLQFPESKIVQVRQIPMKISDKIARFVLFPGNESAKLSPRNIPRCPGSPTRSSPDAVTPEAILPIHPQ